jgi:D-3-phosphoglycerate dehydrogenase
MLKELNMQSTVDTLILDLLEWIGPQSRPYAEVIEAWRTLCPRLPVWEDANDRGFIEQRREPGLSALVSVTTSGQAFLRENRPPQAPR